jgi:hypothetical protein
VSIVIGIDPGPYSCKTLKVSFSSTHPMSLSHNSVRTAFIVFPLLRFMIRLTSVRVAKPVYVHKLGAQFQDRGGRTKHRRRRGVAAGQGRVTVDNINRLHTVHLPYSSHEAAAEQIPRT